jgi:hypothetical protein
MEDERIDAILKHVEELRKPKKTPWYERSPFKEMLTHAVTVLVALSLGWTIHELTGAPMPAIEAKNEKHEVVPTPAATTAPTISPSAFTAYTLIPEEVQADEVVCPPAAPVPEAKKKVAKAVGTAMAAAPRTYPATAPAAAAPVPAAAPPSAIDAVSP